MGIITINRPKKYNALNLETETEIGAAFDELEGEQIKGVMITGAGEKAFSAGADIKGVKELLELQKERAENQDILKLLNRVVLSIRQASKPVVAAVNGVAAGGAANLVLACDIIVASEKAKLVENFINIGLVPDGGGTYFLLERIGYHRAAEIFFTGKILSAQEAFNLGLYNRVVPPEEVLNTAQKLAQELAQKPTLAIAACKSMLNRKAVPKLRACLENEAQYQRLMVATQDAKEGITSFIEKRKPKFIGK